VFGKSTMLAKTDLPVEERVAGSAELLPPYLWGPREQGTANEAPKAWQDFEKAARETPNPLRTPEQIRAENAKSAGTMSKAIEPNAAERSRDAAEKFSWIAFGDILVFFGVLLVGFAYLWRRGDLDWVRSIAAQETEIDLEPEVRSQRSEVSSVTA
jgi:NADH-quinone oxidoreductase subunit A